eukprot:CAMPEP_0170568116 /NCGR_PEP_ID=MMETSP0211-20121228/80934_1 /TAXON_ID=311385 /ORGANISM="Pseudokeronopsis sp., Strain OXSARD2" /LENGTH=30 /DNA_ID= /DNA_START= /DNA_END= /DNA_ORIENTATION=
MTGRKKKEESDMEFEEDPKGNLAIDPKIKQ